MTELLDEMETALADVIQSGFSSAGESLIRHLEELDSRCENQGLHTGAALLHQVSQGLRDRGHALEKEDLPLAGALCRAQHYITLCRERLQYDQIDARWRAMENQEDIYEHP